MLRLPILDFQRARGHLVRVEARALWDVHKQTTTSDDHDTASAGYGSE